MVLTKETVVDYYNSERLLEKFPAQFRMSAEEIIGTFPRSLPLKRTGNYMSFPFEPVMGFHRDNGLEWYGGSLESLDSKFLIVTFGGSTTVKDNWPKYLRKYAQIEKVKQDIAVLNAGHWGYMSFIEKIYLTSWILPMLEKAGVRPDLILSLDGANDVWTRVMGYFEYKKQESPIWYSQYHGYHQHLDTDIRRMGESTSLAMELLSSISKYMYNKAICYIAPFLPYTLKASLEVSRSLIQGAPSQDELANISSKKLIKLNDDIEDEIINGYKSCLIDFFGSAKVRGIRFVAYLQPVLLERYHPYSIPKSFNYPSFNFHGVHFYRETRHFSRLGLDFAVEMDSMYGKAERLYFDLDSQYPGHFKSLASLFKRVPQTEQIYYKDAIHYGEMGKEVIAHAIIEDLIAKNILER